MYAANRERNAKKDDSTEPINRDTILEWLRCDIQQLRTWATQANTIRNGTRIKCLRASIYGCSVALQALKETELEELKEDMETTKLRVEEIEKERERSNQK